MAEDKKAFPGPAPGKDLTSKIAKAYRSMPAEDRVPQDANDIQNPDLDQAFEKMVDMYKVRRPERENSVVTFPAPAAIRMPRREAGSGPDYECPECGHNNPAANQFCGMCGAAREDITVAPQTLSRTGEPETSLSEAQSGVKHHYYHHHHYRNNPYLLAAIVLLLGVIAWQQWQEYKRSTAAPVTAPAVKAPAQAPAQAQPGPAAKPTSQNIMAPAPSGARSPRKPSTQAPQPAVRPVLRGEPPGPQAKAPPGAPAVIPPVSSLPAQPMPALQTFSEVPARPTK